MLVPLYRVAGPSEYLAITGWKIQDIKLAKKALILPGQRFVRVNVSPVNYTFEVQAMSAEKLPFLLPAVFTIGPRVDSDDSLVLYAKLMAPHDMCSNHVNELVQGIIEGETRVLAASMTQMEAANQAKVVAEAKMKGRGKEKARRQRLRLGVRLRYLRTKKRLMLRKQMPSLLLSRPDGPSRLSWQKSRAEQAASLRGAELQVEVEKKNAVTRTEKLRADLLSVATVEFDIKVQEANRNLYNNQREADAILYKKQKQAEAERASADAAFYTRQQAADADLYGKKKEAEGISVRTQAQGYHLFTLLKALDGNYTALRDYMMINSGTFQEMAKINADTVQGLQPKISFWSSGSGGAILVSENGSGGSMRDVADIYSMLPPLVKTVNEQTGMLPPAWLATLTDGNGSVAAAAK